MLFLKVLDKAKEIEKNFNWEKLVYITNEYIYSSESFQTIKTFGRDIYDGTITLEEANNYQTNFLVEILNFRKKAKPRSSENEQEKEIVFQNLHIFV